MSDHDGLERVITIVWNQRSRSPGTRNFGTREAVGNAVEVMIDVDVIVDADAAQAPFGEYVGLDRQRLERRPVEFFQELAARHAEAADRPLLVEPLEQLADRCVHLGE